MSKTPLCDMLGVEHPIMLAGMGGVSYAEVVAAVSNAGGFGTLGMAGTSAKFIEGQMQRVRELTDKPFGVRASGSRWERRGLHRGGRRPPPCRSEP